MPAKQQTISLVFAGLMMHPVAGAQPVWICGTGADGNWACSRPAETDRPATGETTTGAAPDLPEFDSLESSELEAEPKQTHAVAPETNIEAKPGQPQTESENPAADSAALSPATSAPHPQAESSVSTRSTTAGAQSEEARKYTAPAPAASPEPAESADESLRPLVYPSPERAPGVVKNPLSTPADNPLSTHESVPEPAASAVGRTAAAGLDRGLDPQRCSLPDGPVPLSFQPVKGGATTVEADDAKMLRQEQQAVFVGQVSIRHGEQLLEADEVKYDLEFQTLDASGNVYYERPGLRVTGSRANFTLPTHQGNLQDAEYRLPERNGRGHATTADVDNADLSHYTDLSYTTCPPGNSDWLLKAKKFDADQSTGRGVAHHATLNFRDIPVAYVPRMSFPIDSRRHSGFLTPEFGNSESTGLDLSVPYYFNIAPEMDATFTPRVMSKRGLLLGGELRYLAERHHTELKAEILPDDRDSRSEENSTRGAFSWQAGGLPAARWSYDIDVNYASDDNYLNDMSKSFALTSARHLERKADIRYRGSGWNFLGRLQHYQTIDQNIDNEDRPYSRLPQLLVQMKQPNQALGMTYHLHSEYAYFNKNDNNTVTGHRMDLRPGVSLPMRRSWGYLTPKASLRYTKYQLDDQIPGESEEPDRTLPTLSLDSGLLFERDGSWFGKPITQTLEPRLFYLYTPNNNQQDLPDFDTAERTFSFANLFRENRFTGGDRVGDANQLTTALTSRIYGNQSGQELFRASLGQIVYFRNREVQLSGEPRDSDSDDSSSLVAEVGTQLHPKLRTRAGIQWNPYDRGGKTEKGAASIHYSDNGKRVLNLGYRYDRELFDQTDVSFRWPISRNLHGVGRWNYSLEEDETMATFAGFEYESCCWIARLVAQQLRVSTNDNNESELQNSVFLQLELKGLTSLGDKVDQYLERAIPGYTE